MMTTLSCYRTVSFRDNETNEPYSDQMEIKILELPKEPSERIEELIGQIKAE